MPAHSGRLPDEIAELHDHADVAALIQTHSARPRPPSAEDARYGTVAAKEELGLPELDVEAARAGDAPTVFEALPPPMA